MLDQCAKKLNKEKKAMEKKKKSLCAHEKFLNERETEMNKKMALLNDRERDSMRRLYSNVNTNKNIEKKEMIPICCVCLEDLRSDEISTYVITCGHVFCHLCVSKMLKKCFICKQPLNQAEDTKKIFISYSG